jgi:hypothetical protein
MASKQQSKGRAGVRKRGPAQSKLGKIGGPSKFEKVDTAKLIAEIAEGVPVEVACTAVGIHRDTFYHWLDHRPSFAQALAAEKQRIILKALAGIRTGSKNDEWRGHAWFLERVYRDQFSPPDQGPVFAQNVFTITYEKAREIEQMRTDLLPQVNARLGITNGGSSNGAETAG